MSDGQSTSISVPSADAQGVSPDLDDSDKPVTVHLRGESSWDMEKLSRGESMAITDQDGNIIAQIEVDE